MTESPPWDCLWIGGHLATMAPDREGFGEIPDGALASKGGRIAWVGREADLPEPPGNCAKQVLELDGCWLSPGLVDCHTHLVFAGDRSGEFEARLQGVSYEEIARVLDLKKGTVESRLYRARERLRLMMEPHM